MQPPFAYTNYPGPGAHNLPRNGPPPPESPFYNADLIRTGLGTYGGRWLGSGKDYVQGNINKFLSEDVTYYFQLNEQYVKNKLKIILFPFLHRGHWTRIGEPTPNGLAYKPPRYDINAPDLYIPFMAFATYLVLRCFALGTLGRFTPTVMRSCFTYGLALWGIELVVLKGLMFSIGHGEVPWLDAVAYSGYSMVGVSLCIIASMVSKYAYYGVCLWTGLCMGMFLVKTLRRVLQATEARSYDRDTTKHHYFLLFVALVQVPVFVWFSLL